LAVVVVVKLVVVVVAAVVLVVVVVIVPTLAGKDGSAKIWPTVDFVDLSTALTERVGSAAELLQEVGET
jgi:hypothetical protein